MDNIKVVVKVRPLVKRELDEGLVVNWCTDLERIWPKGCTKDSYTFDAVFGENCSTEDVYQEVARPIVEATLKGINGTIFAYGQTSSGKTYTMMGTPDSPGIIPLAVNQIFKFIDDCSDRAFFLRISFIEIYNEKMKDLLDIKNTDLKIQEKDGCWQVTNCREVVTKSTKDIMNTFEKGNLNRSVGETLMNDASSRSHTIFKITIESRQHVIPGSDEDDRVIYSQLNLVDLAGSERASQTGATKERLREGGHINKSLVTLCRVIRQLSDAQGDPNRFINYRDSKLTHMLQSSLGGNAKTGIICAVTPATLEETHSTLKFAMCAKVIANKPIVNAVISDAKQHKILQEKLSELQKELESKKLVEEDNLRLSEKIAILKEQITIGFGKRDGILSNNTKRRRTWCAPNLQSISENSTIDFNERNNKINPFKTNIMGRFTSECEKEIATNTRFSIPANMNSGDSILCISDSDDSSNRNSFLNPCSPEHKCFSVINTPPCVLRERIKHGQQELKDLEEFTTLEKIYGPKETELINHFNKIRDDMDKTLSERNEAIKKYEENMKTLQNEFDSLKEKHNKVSKLQEQLTQTNVDLEYKLENTVTNHQRKVADLLSCLEEARKNTRFTKPEMLEKICSDNIFKPSNIETNEHELTTFEEKLITEKDIELFTKIEQYCELEFKHQILVDQVEAMNFELKEKINENDGLEKKLVEQELIQNNHISLLENVNSEIEALKYDLSISNRKLQDSEKENSNLLAVVDENNKLKKELEDLRKEKDMNAIINDVDSKPYDRLNVANDELIQLNNVICELNSTITSLESKYEELQEKTHVGESTVKDLNCEIDELKSKLSKSEDQNKLIDDLQTQLNISKEAIENYKSQIFKLSEENDVIMNLKKDLEIQFSEIENTTSTPKNADLELESNVSIALDSLKKENENLKCELLNVTSEVGHLLVESEELEKKTSSQFREQQVADAEFSLLISKLAAYEHYHSSLHSTCESTIPYLKSWLLSLQDFLQNAELQSVSKINGFSPSNLLSKLSLCEDSSIVEEASNHCESISIEKEKTIVYLSDVENSIDVDKDAIDYKTQYQNVINALLKKDFENNNLAKGNEELTNKIKRLEGENDNLSTEIMEYIQELDTLKQKLNSISRNEIGVNTSLSNSSVKDVSITCDIPMTVENDELIASLKDSRLLEEKLEKDIEAYKTKVEELNDALNNMNLKCETLSNIENELTQSLNCRQIEIEHLTITIDRLKYENEESILEKERSNNQIVENLQQQIADIQSQIELKNEELSNQKLELSLITRKYEDMNSDCNKISSDYESEKLYAEKRHKILMEEMNALKISLSQVEADKINALDHCSVLKDEMETYKSSLLEKENKYNAELKIMQTKISNLNDELDKLKDEIQTRDTLLINKENEIKNYLVIEHDKQQALDECNILKKEIDVYKASLLEKDNALQQLTELREKSNSLTEEIDKLKLELNEKDQILKENDEHIKEKKIVEENYAKFIKQLVDLWKSISIIGFKFEETPDAQDIVNGLHSEFLEYQVKSKLQNELSTQVNELKSTIECVKRQLNAANMNINVIQDENKTLNSCIKLLSKILSQKENFKLDNVDKLVASAEMLITKCHEYQNSEEKCREQIKSLQAELDGIKMSHINLVSEKNEIIEKYHAAEEKNSISQSKMGVLETFVTNLFKSIEIFNSNEPEMNFTYSFSNLENEYLTYKNILNDVKNKIISMEENNMQIYDRLKNSESKYKEKNEQCEILIHEKELLEKDLEETKSKMSTTKLPASYAEFFVDKMTHEIVQDKNKELQKVCDDLRWKYRDVMADFRRVQHALQNNTVNNLLPQNGEEIAKLKERIVILEKELQGLQSVEKAYKELKDKCKKYNEEYEACIQQLKEKELKIEQATLEKIKAEKKVIELSAQLAKKPQNISPVESSKLEYLQTSLAKKEQELKALQLKFEELDEECEMCAQRLREKEAHSMTLYTEKKKLEAQVSNLEIELKEITANIQQQERKKKRQSLLDMNRGLHTSSANSSSTESNDNNASFESLCTFRKMNELENEKKSLQTELNNVKDQYKIALEQLKEFNKMKARSNTTSVACQATNENISVLSPRKLIEQNVNTVGSGIVLNQRMSEYIIENERLAHINNKLKQLCRMRDKKIKELENKQLDKEN